ncbi:MAG: 3-hydroxyacyl-CoA dehydrogenase NAD-binding domain-containing protein [Phenylobacterium sp.]|nr:3-hydroxyacyl-CoA dehydrogenase NAD-binding domain-containing protein [Phenylobacterium sp.]
MTDIAWKTLEPRLMELGPDTGAPGPWKAWRLTRDEDGIDWLVADQPGASANTVSEEVLEELDQILAKVEQDAPKALVIRSAKPGGFFAGADVKAFVGARDATEVEQRMTRAHEVVDRLARLSTPTVAVIHGYALGGGLEIALACDHRIVVGEDARLGFPEVQLGLHPGLGGTARLLDLIDPLEAMQMMLTGKAKRPGEAKAIGLADAVTDERHVAAAVAAVARGEFRASKPGRLSRLRHQVTDRILHADIPRRAAADRMRSQAAKQAPPEHYPAPGALVDLWERHGDDLKALRKAEIASFAHLMTTDAAQNLIRVFFLRETMKRLTEVEAQAPRHLHVIGAGAMGGDIAAWAAWHGIKVTLADLKPEIIAQAIGRAATLYPKLGHDSAKTRDALDRLIPDPDGQGVRHADLIIEAAPEKLDLKRKIYADLEPRMKPGAVLATNTSSIRLEDLVEGLERPERLIGIHFFNPVSRMQLVEIVTHEGVATETLDMAKAFLGAIDRLPAPVRSAPGFLVNRALTPYMLEAMVMMQEGHAPETIDAAAEAFGMPVGPAELADQVGLDVGMAVADSLKASLDKPLPVPPDTLRAKVTAGDLGRKTGKGVYAWKEGEPQKVKSFAKPTQEMTDRLILPMIDACLECLREGVVEDEDIVDGAMIFGAGFAPFRGGPIHYARSHGAQALKARMETLAATHGERFRPDQGWDRLT